MHANLEAMIQAAQNNDAVHAAAQAALQTTNTHPDWVVGVVISIIAAFAAGFAAKAMR